ncbi:carboxypeptidase M32 [Halorhabdus sp. BNX81]|uniref:carboxypeptidase M32 n=1 Tax=Halorhabdus sp. BNX81 TaxID=2980181 RepID=UPI0023DD4A35|nr:carboxypeptidase M32 [Halorhabdus sp. BNX81]WEL21518.1 Zn-dependent carboxypeptidase, M32 family [Halorhabdus sp. BNX81]
MSADTPDVYDEFLDHVQQLSYVADAGGLLQWDQQVMMPEGGTPARSKQQSALSTLHHDLLTDDDLGEYLAALEDTSLDPEQQAVVREIRREHERARKVPRDLVERISEATSEALPVWEQARADDDFETYAPVLEELVDLRREYAEAIDPDRDPYAVLFEEFEPHLGLDTAERILGRLRDELVPLIDEIADSEVTQPRPFDGTYPVDEQEALVRAALEDLGFDWDRGRLDTSSHPFTSGTQFDARITTRFDEAKPLDSLSSTIHEFGHATYALGLPDEQYGTPLGDARDLTVHESQSRLWENHVGRSHAFWEYFMPTVKDHLGIETSAEDAYCAVNRVYDDNPIRVEADELTYHMHIVLRFEIERDLIAGDLDVSEVPAVWNDKMEEYLGIRPDTDAEGCLQDIHWTNGTFGYFPTYSLGSVLAAQLYDAAEAAIGPIDDAVRAGEFEDLHEWLTQNVHRHGKRYTTDALIEEATGQAYTADHFLEYVTEKYGALYDL